MQSEPINILTIQFANEISQHEIPLFRGAINHSLENKSILFHNHDGDKFRYSYPLIQYKRIKGKAAIVCLNQGSFDIGELFASNVSFLRIKEREMTFAIERIIPQKFRIQTWTHSIPFRINRWIPFNSKNYQEYKQCINFVEKIKFLENILIGNILSFAKGLDIRFDNEVKCEITKITETPPIKIKGVAMQSFQAEFSCNVFLPDYIGLGKHVSINYGVVTQIRNNTEE